MYGVIDVLPRLCDEMAVACWSVSSAPARPFQPMVPTAAAPVRMLWRVTSPTMARSRDLLVGLRLRGAVRRLRQRADNAAPRQVDLEGVVRVTFGVAQQHARCLREAGL